MGKILDSTNIKDSRYLFSQTPPDFQNDNYYLNSLQMKIDADWPYRPNRKWVEEENIPGTEEYKPLEVTLEEAIQLIEAKRSEEQSRILRTFAEEPELQIINGRYGAYIAYKKSNYKLPKGAVAEDLTIEDCKKIIAEQGEKPTKKTTKKSKAKKS